ncbi:MAG: hypothetical protein KC713_05725 [Candidatus Omnitrophica bacterium]|nr:hypothetical protein [Candidatus Omnitrophota bacterium]
MQQRSSQGHSPEKIKNDYNPGAFPLFVILTLLVVSVSVFFFIRYNPGPQPQQAQQAVSLEQKMAYLESGTPLPNAQPAARMSKWMVAMILVFVIFQIAPLLMASYKVRSEMLTRREVRQIEFLTETPLYLGLLGSLLGVCMTHFLSGTLSAPLAYLTTISGILLYLFGRFTILVSLPSSNDFN